MIEFSLFFHSSRMYYDEDGDLAEEFYEEVTPQQGGTPWMRRITKNLTWQVLINCVCFCFPCITLQERQPANG